MFGSAGKLDRTPLEIRCVARSPSRSSKIIVKVFIRFNGRHEVIVSERYALCRCESVGHADRVFDLHSLISKTVFRSANAAILTCRPLNSLLLRSSNWFGESLPPSPVVETLFACWIKAVQISAFAFLLNWSYLIPRWMRLWTASSKTVTLFVVKIITPWKYSNCRRKTETRVLCCRWCWVRASRKTSASSRRRMAFQRATRSRISARQTSSFSESRPRSPAHTYGERVNRRRSFGRSHGEDELGRAVVSGILKLPRQSVSFPLLVDHCKRLVTCIRIFEAYHTL